MNNCIFFGRRLRRLVHEREAVRLSGREGGATNARLKSKATCLDVEKCRDPDVQSLRRFLYAKFVPPPSSHHYSSALRSCQSKVRQWQSSSPPPHTHTLPSPRGTRVSSARSGAPALTHWLFYLMWNYIWALARPATASTTTQSSLLSLSFSCLKTQNNLSYIGYVLFFNYFSFKLDHLMR